jgi:SAM-dependent methyltransferase
MKKNDWFINYQSMNGLKGQRNLEFRKNFFDSEDFKDKTILDIGCNMGQMCQYAISLGAKHVLGIDYDKSVIQKANLLNKSDKIQFVSDDIDNYFMYTQLEKKDTILLLSVIGTLELENRYGILAKLASKTKIVLYLEGHISSKYEDLVDMIIKYTDFTNIEFKGIQYDNKSFLRKKQGRPFFRCSRNVLSRLDACNKINNLLKNKHIISVVGNGGVGKSHFKYQLIQYLYENSHFKFDSKFMTHTDNNSIVKNNYNIITDKTNKLCILDDVVKTNQDLENYDYVIYFDYRALEYLNKTDTIFYIKYEINNRFKNRPSKYQLDHSPTIKKELLKNIKNIYHIEKY